MGSTPTLGTSIVCKELRTISDELTEIKNQIASLRSELEQTRAELVRVNEQLAQVQRQLVETSITDALTGLYNRRYFEQRLAEEFERSVRYEFPIACVLLDIHRLVAINETHGYHAGDKVLQEVAAVVRGGVRDTDIAARYERDAFIVLLPYADWQVAQQSAERIRARVEGMQIAFGDQSLKVTLSGGLASLPSSNPEMDYPVALLERAQLALDRAKAAGGNRIEVGHSWEVKPPPAPPP